MAQHSSLKLSPLAASIASILYPASAVLAQEQENTALEEVLVTATLRETTLQEVPQSILSMNNAEIQKANLQSLEDLVRAVPSLSFVSRQPGRNDIVYRGISTGSQEFYTETQTAVYLDEASISLISQQPMPQFVDLERFESLPGPQGTLFGSASQAGTLRIITRKPQLDDHVTAEVFGEVNSTKGGDLGWRAEGWINVPLGESFAIRAVGYSFEDGGYIDNVLGSTYRPSGWVGPNGGPSLPFKDTNADLVGEDVNTYELTGGRISALWEMTDNWSARLSAIAEDSTANYDGTSDPLYGDFKIAKFHEEFRDDSWVQYALNIEGDLGWAVFNSNTAYFDRDIVYEWENMHYEQYKDSYWGNGVCYYAGYGYYNCGYPLYNTNYTYGIIFNDQWQTRKSQEFRLTSKTESRFQWMVGLYYEDLEDGWFYGSTNDQLLDTSAWYAANYYYAYWYNYYGYNVDYPLTPTNLAYTMRMQRQTEQISVFGEMSFDFTEKLRGTIGARWFEYDRSYFEQNQFPEGLPPPGSQATNGSTNWEASPSDTLWKFAVEYKPDDTKMFYALYSEGFRLGGTNPQRAVEGTGGFITPSFDPDQLVNYELGMKTEWLDRRLLLNATAFFMEWEGFQQSVSGGAWWLRGTINATDKESKGIEANTRFLVSDNFSIGGSMLYLKGKFTKEFEYLNPDGSVGGSIPKGTESPTQPEWKFNIFMDYNWPGAFGTEEMFFHYDWAYQESTWNDLGNASTQNPNGIVPDWKNSNFRMGARLQNDWTVSFYIRNVFDQKAINWLDTGSNYITDHFLGLSDYSGDPMRLNVRSYNRPRQFGLQIRKGWY